MFHRIGVKKLLVGSLVLLAIAQFSLIRFSAWYIYIGLMMAIGFLNSVSMPAVQGYIGFRWKERRRELFNLVYVRNNIGMALGTSVAGLLASSFSFSVNFAVNGLSTLGFAIFFLFFMKTNFPEPSLSAQESTTQPIYDNEVSSLQLLLNVKLYLFMVAGSMLIWFSNFLESEKGRKGRIRFEHLLLSRYTIF